MATWCSFQKQEALSPASPAAALQSTAKADVKLQ